VVAFARAKLAPMVRGLFPRDEQETVLDVLGRRVEDWRASIRLRWLSQCFSTGPQSGCHRYVSSPRHVKRSRRISRTPLPCVLRVKGYETDLARSAFGGSVAYSTSSSQTQPSPSRISPVSGPATYWTLLSSRPCLPCCQGSYNAAGPLRSIGITRLPHYYRPVRHPLAFGPLPGVAGYRAYLPPTISRRGEEGFSSCLACPCHRAVAFTPPKWVSRIGQISAAHAAFAQGTGAQPSG
jgi:hypothetical protein